VASQAALMVEASPTTNGVFELEKTGLVESAWTSARRENPSDDPDIFRAMACPFKPD
jgi:hypothetical protein